MNDRTASAAIRNLTAVLLFFACAAALAQTPPASKPPARDRVFVRDLEGVWLNEDYIKALSATRAPHAASKRAAPVAIAIKRDGRSYPAVITDFNKAVLNAVLDVEPDGRPGAYRLVLGAEDRPMSSDEVKYLRFEGSRNAQKKFDRLRFADTFFMKGRKADFMLLAGDISPYINRVVIAGRYKDEKGRDWAFSEAGEARWPDQTFTYELSLNDPGAGCEYLQTEEIKEGGENKRFGYAWKGGKLSIFPARVAGKQVRCDARPIAVLSPQ
jgi:hypothetical protein